MQFLRHYGTPRRSGRYPWGSGEDPRNASLSSRDDALKRKGLGERERAKALGMSISTLRAQKSLEKAESRAADVAMAIRLKEKGMSTSAIARRMDRNESSVRALLDTSIKERADITKNTATMLKAAVDKGAYIDIGKGTEVHLGIPENRLKTSVKSLEAQGYKVINIQVDQLGTDRKTTVKVLAPPGTTYKEVVTNTDKIKLPMSYSEDKGRTYLGIKPPVSISSKRLKIKYAEDGGEDKDGVIELRRGVEDLSLGKSRYAQVRIAVDGTHYLKGMAIYSDDLPRGVDIQFNTNKKRGTPFEETLKPIKSDPENPFGSSITQYHYTDSSGKKRQSPINIVGTESTPNVEGAWGKWTKSISSQVLSKQPPTLAKQQLGEVVRKKEKEFEELKGLTNPIVKKRLLTSFADDADSSAVHLKAAALPRQRNHVILPIVDMPENHIYAPNYKNGERVVLIRHPHGGKFEIPELTVNNTHRNAKKILGDADDAVGIHPKVAKKLSGADFDGDTVLVIPNPKGKNNIKTSATLSELKNFDPQTHYPYVQGMKVMGTPGGGNKGLAMGDISNLITDMSIKGAPPHEIARAVKHSMVVIDAEKHKLNYKQSALDNGIAELKTKYQGGPAAGAATIVSRASAEARVPHRKEGALIGKPSKTTGKPTRLYIDPKTGKKLYTETGESYTKVKVKTNPDGTKQYIDTGVVKKKETIITKMEAVDDAHKLSSGTPMERIYADHANALKSLGNKARLEVSKTKDTPYSPEAHKTYSKEVASLKVKVDSAYKNKPLERQAQLIANDTLRQKKAANTHLSKEDLKTLKGQVLSTARLRVGAKKPEIIITPAEWVAIQKGAVTPSFLKSVIDNADLDNLRSLATPRQQSKVTPSTVSRMRALSANGHTKAEIAEQLGVSVSTVINALE